MNFSENLKKTSLNFSFWETLFFESERGLYPRNNICPHCIVLRFCLVGGMANFIQSFISEQSLIKKRFMADQNIKVKKEYRVEHIFQ